jgi:acyl-CoA thioester hydrolase
LSEAKGYERDAFKTFVTIATRWMDNDVYGHVNNVVYYSFFDTAVNQLLMHAGLLDLERSPVFGLVVETGCRYFAPVSFPGDVEVGVRVARIGTSSVRYEVALFAEGAVRSAAGGHFTHVYVDRGTRRPSPLPDATRAFLEALLVDPVAVEVG